ncbi:extracellular solute-binding protein [Peptacetobacter hiranonis]|uniref:ABC transporter, permease protein n=1 Tax=Peptacetobacter hiranonis (strain DSM 13275 / JCM 10541 / KCTC 15199 / TO-931) TaxID=500633 RepID=B6G0X1_PEPHT|nr:extracellular solute-binding protein [Peptacetobacter hiranonis]EEA84546.1 ABC transporter, permease protein [Peptacetobacter hiranonis DSM 13275]QEK21631.1 hypothetical protein KGNDJEFE_02125 [Peptacetobacter hiranonis]
MKLKTQKEIKSIFAVLCVVFGFFLIIPLLFIFKYAFVGDSGLTIQFFSDVFKEKGFTTAIFNSLKVSAISACISTVLAFILSYTVQYTNVKTPIKKLIKSAAVFPMLLPTITYGFAIIYSFGKQGLVTTLLGKQFFEIYGLNGLVLGFVIYTLPISYMLTSNTMRYVDKKFSIVSRVMGDKPLKTFLTTVLRPLAGTLAAAFVQTFFLSFTDFGIPASIGGKYDTIASVLYSEMLGSIPNFNNGAVVALVMLIPTVVGIAVLTYLEKYNIRYQKISEIEIRKGTVRDTVCGILSVLVCAVIIIPFVVIFIAPFVKMWPYDMNPTIDNFTKIIKTANLGEVYLHSIGIAAAVAGIGMILTYAAALVTARSQINKKAKSVIETISLITNTVPGMVIGIAYLLMFTGTSLQNTFTIIIVCTIVHYFSTPYLMFKNSLSKMNSSWETTAMLMGDSWIKTIIRIVTPNSFSTICEVISYYFVNAMVTISAVVFLVGAKTATITTKIKELQYFAKFDEIFILSIMILTTNIVVKVLFQALANRKSIKEKRESEENNKGEKRKMSLKKKLALPLLCLTLAVAPLAGCSKSVDDQVVIYSNADEEAVEAMSKALDENGYDGKYTFQTFGTSELGGKLLAEGTNIEADMVTMSSFYLDSAQEKNNMFEKRNYDVKTLDGIEAADFYAPITSQEGAIIVNTEMLKENGLKAPTSIKDLANPEYKGFISVTDVASSSTAWLLVQAIISEYGEVEGKEILSAIYENAGDHIEESGSAPLKKVRAGEVAIGFGLRHQAVADKEEGLPIDFIDPTEGNFSLTESVAVVKKDNAEKAELSQEMAKCIIENGRQYLIETYPNAIYEGEKTDNKNHSKYPKTFSEPLTAELLEKHIKFSDSCK